ncbi:hypothetical protein BerOc1_02476 [Pseudodesulfovibrio hydrargyri]|uniref:Lipoprotein n=1 Tax=Pseudodesulfovibrio hydrargyri TaxID=2125990 RepID=A0A1J5MX59_9BACT|nr:hypothetical protein [Pseudodesulfovibrio hydrargyri]OIQ50538.1 hypothetical protein BerOc1_02476 [Pseudodesulfovibrio hydrargyri]
MKRLLLLIPFILLLAACAARGPLTEERRGNVVAFARADTGNAVTVTLSPGLEFDKHVRRDFMGATVEGWLYRAEDGTSVLVSSMDRARFEDLIGRTIEAPKTGIKAYPPQTSWLPRLCQLVRAYVVSLDSDVVAAVKFGPRSDGECDGLVDNDEYMAAHLDEVAEFDRRAEREISVDW